MRSTYKYPVDGVLSCAKYGISFSLLVFVVYENKNMSGCDMDA
jgi:hypothetical protein